MYTSIHLGECDDSVGPRGGAHLGPHHPLLRGGEGALHRHPLGDVALQVDVVVEVTQQLHICRRHRSTCVADELALRHLILYLRTGKVLGQHEQGEAEHVDYI